jgi:hypothetical protein
VTAKLPNWWRRHFLAAEFGVALAVAGGLSIWMYTLNGSRDVSCFLMGNRDALYGALAGIFGALLGFVITTLSIVVALASVERLAVVRESAQYPTLWRTFRAAIRSTALATAASIVALALDRHTDSFRALFVVVVFATSLAVLRLSRAIWILNRVLGLAVGPGRARAPGE